jgi:hypothetical protein
VPDEPTTVLITRLYCVSVNEAVTEIQYYTEMI